jgi:hypothetical protein
MSGRKENVTLKMGIVSLVVFVISIGMIYISIDWIPSSWPVLREIVRSVGTLLIVSVVLGLIWDLFLRRSYTLELLEIVGLSSNINDSGLDKIGYRFGDIDWKDYFNECKEFEMFISYGRSWRGTNELLIAALASRSKVKVRIALPDPKNDQLVNEMSVRYNKSPDEIRRLVNEAIQDFNRIFKNCKGYKLATVNTLPYYGYYRFDDRVIISLYNYGKEKVDVPTFFVSHGRFHDFLINEFDTVFRNRQVSLESN